METTRSRGHRRLEKVVEAMGLGCVSEQPFDPFCVDIYLPEFHLALEFDGPRHSKRRDEQRDAYLWRHYRLPILRFTAADLQRAAVETTEWKIELLAQEFAPSAERRKRIAFGGSMTEEKIHLNDVAAGVAATAKAKGFQAPSDIRAEPELTLAKLALIHSEVSEALEAAREGDAEAFGEELADILIRVLHLASALGIDIQAELLQKAEKNKSRERLHGKLI